MRSYFIIFFSVFSIFSAHSQSNQEITSFVSAAQSDINTIGAEYFNPLFKSVQLSMSEGWVQSAKPHKKFGFNFTSNMSNTGYFYSTKSTYHNTTSDYDRHISAQYSSGMDARRTTSEALIGSFNSGYADTLQVGGATFGDLA